MSLILVIQPDPSQARVLHDVAHRIGAELEIVDSSARAVAAIERQVPDLILLSSLLSPRDEDTLMASLRALEGAAHLQTLAIPQFRAAEVEKKGKKSAFRFGKKPKAAVSVGCDPAAFGDEVVTQLARASEIRKRPAPPQPVRTVIAPEEPVAETLVFEAIADSAVFEPFIEAPVSEPVFMAIVPEAAESIEEDEEDEIDKLVRQLGLDVRMVEIEEVGLPAPMAAQNDEETFDFAAALDRARVEAEERRTTELAQLQFDAEEIREAAIAEARATAEREARAALAIDLARVQAEAEGMREVAIAEARAAAEHEARQTLHAELARVRSETEVTVADVMNKAKVEAEESERARAEAERLRVEAQAAFAAELARVRAEVEQKLTVQLEAAREEAERMRAAEAAAGRERAAAEAQLKSELDRLRFVAAQVRKADESETKKAADQIKHLEGELVEMRTKAEQRQLAELDEIKAQMVEMREAAARHVRAAAAEAVAAEVAHVVASTPAPRPTAVIAQFPIREVVRIEEPREASVERPSRDYLTLWQPAPEPVAEAVPEDEEAEESVPFIPDLRHHAKWALPVAACLLLVTTTGAAISTVARFVRPAEKPPALTVEPVEIEPFIEVVVKRVGRLQVESTPSGAEAVIDGRSYGKTPVSIPGLEVGSHTLVLKSGAGSITRKVTIKANQTTLLSEAIFSGWLAIFSPIPVKAVIDGKPVNLTDDGRFMTTPGKHIVELISERFNFRATETLHVRPGETTAHTVSLPTGSVRVTAPDGAEIRIDGQPATGVPAQGIPVAIGSHAITATHAQLGERRVEVDVRQGSLTEVTLVFE